MQVYSSSVLEAGKWAGLVGGMWVQAFAGNAYTFSHFSTTLKHKLHYSQIQLNNLGVAKDLGENVGLLPGFLSNKLHPFHLLSIGALSGLVGYGVVWLVVSQYIERPPYWLMCVALCVGANSTTWFNTAVLVTCMRNFPHSRGTVVGFLKGFVGLSGAIFTQLFIGFLEKDPVKLLLLLTLGPTIVCLISMGFIRPIKSQNILRDDTLEKKSFGLVYVVCLVLAFFLLVSTLFSDLVPLPNEKYVTLIMLILLVAPVYVPLRMLSKLFFNPPKQHDWNGANQPLLSGSTIDIISSINRACSDSEEQLENENSSKADSEEKNVLKDSINVNTKENDEVKVHNINKVDFQEKKEDQLQNSSYSNMASQLQNCSYNNMTSQLQNCSYNNMASQLRLLTDNMIDSDTLIAISEGAVIKRKRGPRRGEDFKLKQAVIKADFWLLFFSFFCGVGTGVTAINNLGQIGAAQGHKDVTMYVSLIGIFNFLGRLGGGSISEHYVRLSATPRPIWMAVAQALMIVAHVLFASALRGSLLVASSTLGFCYGVQFSVMVPTASELFGLRNFGIIYNFISMADPLGSLLFSGILAGYVYDWETAKQGGGQFHPGLKGWLFNSFELLNVQTDQGCTGAHCFRLTFLVMAGICMIGVILSVVLTSRIRPVYKNLYGPRDPNNLSSSLLPPVKNLP